MNITSDGVELLRAKAGVPTRSRIAVMAHGDFGTAEAWLMYKGEDGEYHQLQDGLLSDGYQFEVRHGMGTEVYVSTSNADAATNFFVEIAYL